MRSFIVNTAANLLVIGQVRIHGHFSIRHGFYSLQLRIAPLYLLPNPDCYLRLQITTLQICGS